MDINVDQGLPRGDLIMTNEGKYFYKDRHIGSIEIDRFSREFDQYKIRRIQNMKNKINKLNELEQFCNNKKIIYKKVPFYDLTLSQLYNNTKNTILNIFCELLKLEFNWNIFMKDDRPFYLGIFLVCLGLLLSFLT